MDHLHLKSSRKKKDPSTLESSLTKYKKAHFDSTPETLGERCSLHLLAAPIYQGQPPQGLPY